MTSRDTNSELRKKLMSMADEYAREDRRNGAFPGGGNSWPTVTPVDERLKGMAAERYQQILEAIKRLNQGAYGSCEDCGGLISEERLEIIPEAGLCVDCQRAREAKRDVIVDARGHTYLDQLM